jgi:hypothetical protein
MNRRQGFFLQLFIVFSALAAAFVITVMGRSSSRNTSPAEAETEAEALPAWEALAILKTGENPLWFELGEDGPALISSPAEAGLGDYKPWPLSRHIAGMLSWEDSLVLASNRDGFIILDPRPDGGITLYRAFDPAYWDAYSIASFYVFEEKPTILLYRDDFFSDPARPLSAPALSLDWDSNVPIPVDVPFLQSPVEGDNWEPVALMRGPDGSWYGRWTQPGAERPQSRYLRASSLADYGVSVSVDAYRNAAQPEPVSKAPSFAAGFFDKKPHDFAAGLGSPVLEHISPSYEGKRLFSMGRATGSDFQDNENVSILRGFYRESPAPFIFILLPDGRGVSAGEAAITQFMLPALPGGYVYTSAGLTGDVLVASWEEQQDLAVGSAGFMAVDVSAFISNY